jgi:hypothetical protein
LRRYNEHQDGTSPSTNIFSKLANESDENGRKVEAENIRQIPAPDKLDVELSGVLAPDHRTMLLQESGISAEVVRARGYRTIERKTELKLLGFSDNQCNPPGLLIPIYSPSGKGIVYYQFRPDEPRIKDGKPVKYETPQGSRMVLDVHPFAREKLGDPSVPLWITEGIKKGDALVSRDLCAVALLGVWNWRGTNERGGKVVLPEWEHIALNNGRKVRIVFDSDVLHKPQVHTALARLKNFLEVK